MLDNIVLFYILFFTIVGFLAVMLGHYHWCWWRPYICTSFMYWFPLNGLRL